MTLKIFKEALCFAFLYSEFLVILFVKKGAKSQIQNYPIAIQNRCIEIGITTKKEIIKNAKFYKTLGVALMLLMSLFIICGVNKETTFIHGFIQSYLFIIMFSLFDALFIDSLWFCHSKFWIIPGTEDMASDYHDYAFHWKWFFLSFIYTIPMSMIIGGLTYCIGKA